MTRPRPAVWDYLLAFAIGLPVLGFLVWAILT
jgi:hypothetical protein